MNKDKEVLHHKAEFLNRPGEHEDASIFSSILRYDRTEGGNKIYSSYNVTFKIRDCSKDIWLDFDIEDHDNNQFKLDVMINHIQEFKRQLADAYYVYAQEQNEKKD